MTHATLRRRIKSSELRVLGEPKEPIPGSGYGLSGAMVSNKDGTKILCHECGELYSNLGTHLDRTHRLSARKYKDKHGLYYGTALVSPTLRETRRIKTLRSNGSARWLEKYRFTNKSGKHHGKKGGPVGATAKKKPQHENDYGTCLEQLRRRIIEEARHQGVPPYKLDVDSVPRKLAHDISRRFVTWRNGKRILLGVPYSKTNGRQYYDANSVILAVRTFKRKYGRMAYYNDLGKGILPSARTVTRWFGSLNGLRTALGWPIIVQGLSNFRRKPSAPHP